jgi:nucleoside-diphosphate-sugar epimerase
MTREMLITGGAGFIGSHLADRLLEQLRCKQWERLDERGEALVSTPGSERPVLASIYIYRARDIRHCFADTSQAQRFLGYEPRVRLDADIIALAPWLENQIAVAHVPGAHTKLFSGGLIV